MDWQRWRHGGDAAEAPSSTAVAHNGSCDGGGGSMKVAPEARGESDWRRERNFKVYVIRIWEHQTKFNEKEGGRGHASIPKSIIKKWSGAFQVFQMYIITNFIVVDKRTIKKPTTYHWILNFSHRTEVNHIMNPTFPLHAFLFKITSELLTADKIDNSELFG
ncbi:hypothetical protein Ahy_B01g053041 [Arachis hypogaea]|uniref:DUF223 domain-containing protein n=1 Tax=Arachis hypogaea TaxID=3818 RepID=A0A445AQY3_ARAHY|nr:hypothetical protein Ahy_B01g053041 [Arachis hypogaea]